MLRDLSLQNCGHWFCTQFSSRDQDQFLMGGISGRKRYQFGHREITVSDHQFFASLGECKVLTDSSAPPHSQCPFYLLLAHGYHSHECWNYFPGRSRRPS
jgi:hypothetical protein